MTPRSTDVTVSFQSEGVVNDGVLLPIDVITVNEIKAEAVLGVSPDLWFGNELRERLSPEEIQKLALRERGKREVSVRVPGETGKIIVYADYENVSERPGQQIVIFSGKGHFQDHYLIRVHNHRLELAP